MINTKDVRPWCESNIKNDNKTPNKAPTMTTLLSNMNSRLLRPILFAVVAIILCQTVTLLSVTRNSVDTLETQVISTLTTGSDQMSSRLKQAEDRVSDSIDALSRGSSAALSKTLTEQLNQEQQQVSSLLTNSVQQTAKALAEMMAIAAPKAIWDKDSPALTQLVRNLHRNPMVVFARYYDMDGKPLTRHLDKRLPKVKELIKNGKGRGTMNKVLDAAKRDPEIYMIEVDINPRGAVIGRFILAVSNKQALEASKELESRFDRLINDSLGAVTRVISSQAAQTQNELETAINATLDVNSVSSQQTEQTMTQSSATLIEKMTFIMAGLGVVMIAILAVIMGIRITNKLNNLTSALHELAAGDGDLTRRINITSKDEIGNMASAVNGFIEKTQKLVQQATGAADTTARQIDQINETCDEAHHAVNRQNEQLQQTSVAISQMSMTTEQVAQRIQQNLSNVDDIRQAGQEAGSISSDVRSNISQLANEVRGAAEAVNNVAGQSEEINTILDAIKGIAEQTNLLALNAAIEAARAGESGRGFAVVSDEVRDLASKTQASTENIQQQIDELQAGVNSAVAVINQASANAESSLEAIASSDQRIQDISDAVQRLYDFTHDIAAMAEEQSQVSHEVNRSVEQISQEANRTEGAVQQNASSADTLAELANSLKSTLGQFRV